MRSLGTMVLMATLSWAGALEGQMLQVDQSIYGMD